MSATLVEPLDISICTVPSQPSTARAEASRANGRRSHGPISPEGKERSRRNGCKDGLTGKGIVLPPDAAAEVDRREAEFARDFRPRNAVERELVRQMALGSWRSEVLAIRIVEHDARMNAARFANWERGRAARGGGAGPAAGRRSRGRRRPAPAHLGRLRLADRPLEAAGQRPVDRRGGRAGLHLDRRRPGAGPGPARPAGGAAPPGRVAGPAGVAPRRGPVGLGGGRGRVAGDHRGARSPSWRSGTRRYGRGSSSRGCEDWQRGSGDRPGARGDAAAPLRGGGRSAVPLGLDEAGAAAEGARRAADARVANAGSPPSPPRRADPPAAPPPAPAPPAPAPARPEAVFPELVAPRRSGGAGARLLGRRPAPARDQPRQSLPRTRRTRRRAGPRREDWPICSRASRRRVRWYVQRALTWGSMVYSRKGRASDGTRAVIDHPT